MSAVKAWHNSLATSRAAGIMQDYPMKLDGPTTELIEKRRASSASDKDLSGHVLPRKLLSRTAVKNDSVVPLPLNLNNALPMIPIPSPSVLTKKPSKSKPTPLNIPASNHSFLPPFLSIFSSKESPKAEDLEGEVSTSRFSRLRHKKSKVEITSKADNQEASFEPIPPMPTSPATSTSDGVSFIMSRGRTHSIGKSIEESTSTSFRALFPPINQSGLNSMPSSIAITSSSRLLPPVAIDDRMEVDSILPILDAVTSPSRSRSRSRTNHSPPSTPRARNQSYPDELKSNLTSAMLDSPIRVNTSSLRPRSKSVSNQSTKPKFIEDAFYSPDFTSYPDQSHLLSTPTIDSASSISISVRDATGLEISSSSCGEEGLSIVVKTLASPNQFEVGWTCSMDEEGNTSWELQLKPRLITPSLFAEDYRVSSISSTIGSSNSSHATIASKIPLGSLPLTTSNDEFGLRTGDYLNGPYTSPRRPSRGALSAGGSSISSEGSPLTPKRGRFPSSARTLSGSGGDSTSEERDNVEIVGSLPKGLGRGSYSADGIEIFQQRSSSVGSKGSLQSNPPLSPGFPKSPNQNRFGRYMPMDSTILLRKDLTTSTTAHLLHSPSSDSSEFLPALSPSSGSFSKSSNLFTKDVTISSSSSSDSLDTTLADGPTRRDINKGLRKMARGRATSKWSDTENDEEEGLGLGKTSWSEVKDCEEDY